jgi:spore maturation protein B
MHIGSITPIVIIVFILIFALAKKVSIFDSFISGAQNGLECSISTIAPLVALITSVTMLKASGALDIFASFIAPVTSFLKFPSECVPLAFMKPISGSASSALLTNILKDFGSESSIGKLAAAIAGSTETLFYTTAIYFGTIKVSDLRHTIVCALIADLVSIICATIMINSFA